MAQVGPTKQHATKVRARRLGRNLLLVLGGSVFALVLAETALRLLAADPVRFAYDAGAGYRNRSGASFDYRERLVRTGDDGCILSPLPVRSGRPDLLVIGDSYAAGQAAPWPDGCVERASRSLAERFPDLACVNLGTSGYGTDQCLVRLRAHIAVRPRLVVYMLFDNDLHDNFDHLHFGLTKPRFELRDGAVHQVDAPGIWNAFLLNLRLVALAARPLIDPATQMVGWQAHTAQQRAALAWALIEEMARVCRDFDAEFVVAAHWQCTQQDPAPDFARLLESIAASDVPLLVINHHVDLAAHYDRDRWHWDVEGHRLVAGVLCAELEPRLARLRR